jgi:hypothetical protein
MTNTNTNTNTNTKFKFGDALVNEVYVTRKSGEETVYVAYYREVFVDDVNVGNLFWMVASSVELTTYVNDPGYWGPTMDTSEPSEFEVDYNLSDTWIVEDETYAVAPNEKLDGELTDLIPELIENGVIFNKITSSAESDIYNAYCDYIVDKMKNNRNDYDYD